MGTNSWVGTEGGWVGTDGEALTRVGTKRIGGRMGGGGYGGD